MLCWPRARRPEPARSYENGQIPHSRLRSPPPSWPAAEAAAQRQRLQSDDVAVVGDTHISKADYDALIAQAKRSFAQQTPPRVPAQGTPEFQTIRGQAVTLLVQQAEREEKATSEGIKITEKQIDARLAQIKKQYFQNSEAKYKAQLAEAAPDRRPGAQATSAPS